MFKNLFYSFRKISRFDKTYVLLKFIIAIFNSVSEFATAYLIKVAISAIEERKEFGVFLEEILFVGVITLISFATLRLVDARLWSKNYRLSMLLSQERALKTLEIDYEVLERPETQDEIEKVNRATGEWSGPLGLVNRFFIVLESVIYFFVASAIILSVNYLLIILIVLLAIVKMLLENADKKNMKIDYTDKIPPIQRRINYVNNIATNFGIGKDVRVYRMDKFIEAERKKATDENLELLKKRNRKNNLYSGMIYLISSLDTVLLYGFMIYEVINNGMSIANFSFMIYSVTAVVESLKLAIMQNSYLLKANAESNDYREFMQRKYSIEKENDTIEETSVSIEFKDVYYSYYNQEGYALSGVSFKINKGEKIALIGYNGAGKTTLIKLLSGFYHPTKGQILINGKDIETLKREEIDKLISSTYQEPLSFAYSIGENIAMLPKKEIDYDKINKILRIIALDKKVDSLPNKIDTLLTRDLADDGVELSGGENQKLSIARAIYKNAPLFIFDEPTSAMDAISESKLYESFKEITKDNTTIYISHRLSSAKFCDRIILLDQGRVLEIGTHDELMAKGGEYKKLFETQAEYYKDGEINE